MKGTLPILLVLSFLLAACGKSSPQTASAGKGVTLTYGENAQVELVTAAGRHIYIDVYNVDLLTQTPSAEDVLLTTHKHNDHYYSSFIEKFPGQQLLVSEGKIEFPDVTITGIASAHSSVDEVKAIGGNNYIYVIDTGGLRIVHFGDIGQEALTETQLAAIGKVDLAITQFANSFSQMSAANLKGFNLMEQVKPHLILPTHSDSASIKIAADRWPGFYSELSTIRLSPGSMPEQASFLILGSMAGPYGKIYSLKPWK